MVNTQPALPFFYFYLGLILFLDQKGTQVHASNNSHIFIWHIERFWQITKYVAMKSEAQDQCILGK